MPLAWGLSRSQQTAPSVSKHADEASNATAHAELDHDAATSSIAASSSGVNPLAGEHAVDCVVLDSAAFIMAAPIHQWARQAYTVPEVCHAVLPHE